MKCHKCGHCCTYRAELVPGLDDIPENLTEFIEEDGRAIEVMKMVNGKCIALDDNARCTIYDKRPLECRQFRPGESRCAHKGDRK